MVQTVLDKHGPQVEVAHITCEESSDQRSTNCVRIEQINHIGVKQEKIDIRLSVQ